MPRTYSPALIDRIAERFKVLSEPMRLRLLNAMRGGELTVGELVDEVETTQANVSRHLALLHRARLVVRRKDGLNVFYGIADPGIFALCDLVCSSLEEEVATQRRALRGR